MKKFVGWLVLLIMAFVLLPIQSLAANNENEKAIDVKVMSYNIHHAVGQDGVLDFKKYKTHERSRGIYTYYKKWTTTGVSEVNLKIRPNG